MILSGGAIAYTMAGTGPAVLLIHGLGGTRATWRHLISRLARTHTVIAPDLPGHGQSDPPAGDYSLGAHACALRDLLLALRRAYSGAWAGLFNTHFWVDPASGVCGSTFSNFVSFGPPEALELYANFEPAVYASR